MKDHSPRVAAIDEKLENMADHSEGDRMKDHSRWVIAIDEKVKNMPDYSREEIDQWRKRSIYKLPHRVTDLDSKSYKPQIVSLGPYHHGAPHLRPMEEHKERALLHFLKRSRIPLEAYSHALFEVAQDLRDAYDELDPKWLNDVGAFLQLMILDGCFILEILRMGYYLSNVDDYAPNDPVFSYHGRLYVLPFLRCDMLLLENQVPLLVLVTLLRVEERIYEVVDSSIKKLILGFFHPSPRALDMINCVHLLDVCRMTLVHHRPHTFKLGRNHEYGQSAEELDIVIPSASELREAGIRFKRSSTTSLRDISFQGNTLRLPVLCIDVETKLKLLNMIAFERFHAGAGNEVSSYVFFLDNLIRDSKDVSMLCSCGIIRNGLGSDEDVVKLFNLLNADIVVDPDSNLDIVYRKVCRKLRNRFRKRLHEWGADLKRTYFRSPWALVSVVAGILLFTLTAIQTVYSVLGYHHQS